jgi:hypothetical protein
MLFLHLRLGRVGQSVLAPGCLSLCSFLFARTANLAAFVPAAVQLRMADSSAYWVDSVSVAAGRQFARSATSAGNVDSFLARPAWIGVALVWTDMTAAQGLTAGLVAAWYLLFAGRSQSRHQLVEGRLPARACEDNVGGKGAVASCLILWVAWLLASMITAIVLSAAYLLASK